MANIIPLAVGDILELKKPHPCGKSRFLVLRVGSEVASNAKAVDGI